MGVWFSCLTTTSTPVWALSSGQAYCGVGGTLVRTSGMISSSSARLNMQDVSPSDRMRQPNCERLILDRAIAKDLRLERKAVARPFRCGDYPVHHRHGIDPKIVRQIHVLDPQPVRN